MGKKPATETNRRLYAMCRLYNGTAPSLYDNIGAGLGVTIRGTTLPRKLRGRFVLNGVTFTVMSTSEKPSLSRVYVECPDCAAVVPAGRVYQHRCGQRRSGKRQAMLREKVAMVAMVPMGGQL